MRCPQCGQKDCCGGDFVAELEAAHTEIERLRAESVAAKSALATAASIRTSLSSPYDSGWQDAVRWINQEIAAIAAKEE